MTRRITITGGLVLGILLVLASKQAPAVFDRLFPLREALNADFIFMVKVDKLDPDRPAVVFKVDENLKGKVPFDRLPVNLKGDAEGQKEQHTPQLLKRLAPDLPVLLFAAKRGKDYAAFCFTNGTWFQIIGHLDKDDPAVVRWAFLHCEPYLRRTFKGTTAELRQVILDAVAKKKDPPNPDPKEKPGLGPEVKPDEKSSGQRDTRGPTFQRGPIFAVIPSFVILGPLALLATLFPAVFGGLALWMKRWLVLLSIASLNSTLFLLHSWFYPSIRNSWWGNPVALWLVMGAMTLAGVIWSCRRYQTKLTGEPGVSPLLPQRSESFGLYALSLASLVVVLICLWRGVLNDRPWKELLVVWVPLWVGALYAGGVRRVARSRPSLQPKLAPEGVMLWTGALACVGLGLAAFPKPFVEAFPIETGQLTVAWRFEADDSGRIVSSPLASGERIYVAAAQNAGFSTFGTLYCLDRASGRKVWSFNDDDGMKQVSVSSPCLADGRLYIGEGFHQDKDCKLYCLQADTGKKLWEFQTKSHTESTPCVADGKVYFGAGDDGIYCLDAATGKEIWHFPELHVDAMLAVAGPRLYAGSGIGDVYNATEIFCLDAETGKAQWRLPVDLPVWGSPTVAGEQVYFPMGNGNFVQSAGQPAGALLCVETKTGKRRWRYDVADGVLMKPAVDGEHVYFGCRDGYCYCLERREGKPSWKFDLGSPVVAAPCLVDRSLYVVASGGQVACLQVSTGQPRWQFDVVAAGQGKPELYSSPLVVSERDQDGERRRLYFGAGLDNRINMVPTLYCLEEQVTLTAVAAGNAH